MTVVLCEHAGRRERMPVPVTAAMLEGPENPYPVYRAYDDQYSQNGFEHCFLLISPCAPEPFTIRLIYW